MSTAVVILLLVAVVGVGISFLMSYWEAAMLILTGRTMSDEKEVRSPTWKEVTPLALLFMAEGFLWEVVTFENPLIQTIFQVALLAVTAYVMVKLMRKTNALPKNSALETDPKKKRALKITLFVGFVLVFVVFYLMNRYM